MTKPERVFLIEVGPRDGFQGESRWIPTEQKIRWIQASLAAGSKDIQIASFVQSKVVPQMADAEEVCAALRNFRNQHTALTNVRFSALALNPKGVERAIAAGIDAIDISMSVSETHSLRNTRRSLAEAYADLTTMVELARSAGLKVRVGLQCAFGCASEGAIPTTRVLSHFENLLKLNPDILSLADSTGMGQPHTITEIVGECLNQVGSKPLVLHLHDTYGRALLNLYTALELGVRHFDTAFGGLGGCPFIPDATGNLATEDVASLLHDLGMETGVRVDDVIAIRGELSEFFERPLPGKARRKAQ
ncbi:MAG: hypothetical protein RIR26_2974 [Pseudomonadota bacterium]